MAFRVATSLAAGVALCTAFLAPQNPPVLDKRGQPWATWNIQRSILSMAANRTGWFNNTVAGSLGVVSYDWSNEKGMTLDAPGWAAARPMNCSESMATQAAATRAVSQATRVFVYRNLVKALPWLTDVREKLEDPAYSGWFLHFAANVTPHVPACDPVRPSVCSGLYHDQEQTPAVPSPTDPTPDGACNTYCDVGTLPVGEYVFDHRNASLRDWLVHTHLFDGTALGHPDVDGLFIDDFWCSDTLNGTGACTDPVQGPTEMDPHAVADMGLSDSDVQAITLGWLDTMTRAQQAILDAGAYTWSLIPEQDNANASPQLLHASSCASFIRPACSATSRYNDAPLLFGITPSSNASSPAPPQLDQDVAAFQLMRGPYAFIGWGVWGMSWPVGVAWNGNSSVYVVPPQLQAEYGEPLGPCYEPHPNVFVRNWTLSNIALDCNTFTASIVMT